MVSPSVIHPACAVESLSKRFFFRASSSSFFFSFKKSTRRYHVWPRSSSSSSSSTRYIINRIEFSSPFTLLVEAIFGGISRGEIGLPTFSLWLPSLHWRPSTCSSHRSIGFLRKDNDIKKKKTFAHHASSPSHLSLWSKLNSSERFFSVPAKINSEVSESFAAWVLEC